MDLIFREARTHVNWLDKPIEDTVLKEIYELMKFGPTSGNCTPLRVVFINNSKSKERLKPSLMDGNIDKTMSAPVTAILAYDLKFFEQAHKLYPQVDTRSWYVNNEEFASSTAIINSSLQSAYFFIAARSLGLDCGPMTGFDNAILDGEFFKGTDYKSIILCNLGYGDKDKLHPRNPRLTFDEACKVI